MRLDAKLTAGNPDQDLVLDHDRRRGSGRTLAGIAVLDAPCDVAGLGIERNQRGVGLMQEDHAIAIGDATVDRVAAHHGNDVRILLGFVLPDDLIVLGKVKSIDLVRERRVDVHHVTDDQRTAFVAAQHAGRECPGDLQLADVRGVDLVQLRVARIGVVARRHDPALRILRHLAEFVICTGGACGERRDSANTGRQEYLAHRYSSQI